jgi:hypothetical protein
MSSSTKLRNGTGDRDNALVPLATDQNFVRMNLRYSNQPEGVFRAYIPVVNTKTEGVRFLQNLTFSSSQWTILKSKIVTETKNIG